MAQPPLGLLICTKALPHLCFSPATFWKAPSPSSLLSFSCSNSKLDLEADFLHHHSTTDCFLPCTLRLTPVRTPESGTNYFPQYSCLFPTEHGPLRARLFTQLGPLPVRGIQEVVSTFMDALTSRDRALSQPSLTAGLQRALRTSTQSLPREATFHQHPLTPNRGWRVCAPVTDSNSPRQACWATLRVRELSFTPRSPALGKNLHLPGSALGSNRK